MPEISRFFGIVIQMHFRDHVPPHFHAVYGSMEAKIQIAPLGLLHGDLSPRVLAFVVEWARMHQEELLDNWHRLQASEAPRRIAPLE